MANATSRARHRAATKPATPLDSLKETIGNIDGRKGLVAAATTGIALGTVWAGSAMAAPEAAEKVSQAAAPATTQVGDAVAKAHLAVSANPEVVAPDNAVWTESQVQVPADQAAQVAAPAENTAKKTTTTRAASGSAVASNSGAWAGQSGVAASIPANIAGGSIADIALRYQGVPYVYGGTTPGGFDCSGFVGYVYNQAGISLPRTSWAQGSSGTHVSAGEAQAGDIVYYGGHVGIYLGEGKMVHAPHPGESVKVVDVYGSPDYVRVGQ